MQPQLLVNSFLPRLQLENILPTEENYLEQFRKEFQADKMDSIQFIKVRKYVNENVDCKRRRQSACTLTEHSDFVGFSNYKTSTLHLVNRRITTAMFSINWNIFVLQIWNHYDSDLSGYLDGDEIDAFLRDMLQQQGCSASTQLIKDYKQFIVRCYVLNCMCQEDTSTREWPATGRLWPCSCHSNLQMFV